MKTNHYVIRNGKLIEKSPLTSSKLYQQPCQRVSIIKSAQIIAVNKNEPNEQNNDDKMIQMKKNYEQIIKKYEQRIKYLEKQLQQKTTVINNLTTFKQISCSSLENIVKQKISSQNNLPNLVDKCEQSFQFCQPNLPDNINSQKILKQKLKKTRSSNHHISQKNTSYTKQQQILFHQVINQQKCNILTNQSNSKIKKIAFFQKINPFNQMSFQFSLYQSYSQGKKYFDCSPLMQKLNKSEDLVKKIQNQLECPLHPITAQLNEQLKQKQFAIKPQKSHQPQLIIPKYDQSDQIYQFIDMLMQKHKLLLSVIEQLQLYHKQQIKQTIQHNQNISSKKQLQSTYQIHINNLINKGGAKIWIENKENLQNIQFLTNINKNKDLKLKCKTLTQIKKIINLQKTPNKLLIEKNKYINKNENMYSLK